MQTFSVNSGTLKGITIGKAFLIEKVSLQPDIRRVSDSEKTSESARLLAAIVQSSEEIRKIAIDDAIFETHCEILNDPALQESILLKINTENKNAEQALAETEEELCLLFAEIDDEYLKQRSADIRDVCSRIMGCLKGGNRNPFEKIGSEAIVVADDLIPSDMALMDFSKIRGLITRFGSITSHVSIIARSKNIPAMVGVGGNISKIRHGDMIILDSIDNRIIIDPDEETIAEFRGKAEKYNQQKELIFRVRDMEAETRDGHKIDLMANAGSPDDVKLAIGSGASGIGLFRSEFLFLQNKYSFPNEEIQFEAYKNAAIACNGRAIIIRTLDIGGDKSLPYFPMEREENPFLGWRAIRISLGRADLFRTQLRALLRASAFGNLKIMFPMIVSLEELRAAAGILENCKNELRSEGIAFNENIDTGVMIETPAAAMIAGILAKEVSFVSIGTNDLIQYMMAADRNNPRVKHLHNPFYPAILKSIRFVVDEVKKQGKRVGLCGEMAANPKAVILLLGMGFGSLSLTPDIIPEIKQIIRNTHFSEAKKMAEEISKKTTLAEVISLLAEISIHKNV